VDREQAKELLSDYLDGELDPEDRSTLEALLAKDSALRSELEALRHTVDTLAGLPSATPPPDFVQGVQRKLRRKGKSPLDLSLGWEKKIPFEAVSILLLGILLALYLILVVLPGEQIEPAVEPPPPQTLRDAGARSGPLNPGHPEVNLPRPPPR